MLLMPSKGFQRSVKKHNVAIDALTEWIEASVVFEFPSLSRNDVVDVLCEENVYDEQDFAHEMVTDAWAELERRADTAGEGRAFEVDNRNVRRLTEWSDNPQYAFCLLLSMQVMYKKWARQFGNDFTEQGSLFEEITVASLQHFGWDVLRTGWSPGNATKIKQVVADVSTHIGERLIPGAIDEWFSRDGNEEQLDVVCSDPFYDGFGGRPLYFFQCASGANWTDKELTPDPKSWQRVISFTTVPQRGLAIPFCLARDEFRRKAGRVGGILLDRFRLQAPSYEGDLDWISRDLRRRLVRWMRPRLKDLPV